MERRAVLAAAAVASAGLLSFRASAAESKPEEVGAALARFRQSIPSNFDRDYVENAVVPFFLTSIYEGERPALPMIDVTLTKENALPHDLWGLIYEGWGPTPEEGVTVFLQGLEKRGDNNLRKTDLFLGGHPRPLRPKYQAKGRRLLRPASGPASSPASRSCGTISTIISTSTGICISA